MNRQTLTISAVIFILAIAVVVYFGQVEKPGSLIRGSDSTDESDVDIPKYYQSYRPGRVDQRRVAECNLRLNGQDFFSPHHDITYSQAEVTGTFKLGEFDGPAKFRGNDMYIHLRPAETPNGSWMLSGEVSHLQHCWSLNALGAEGAVSGKSKAVAKYFPPGDYRADLYLEITDYDEGQNEVYLLGTTSITFLADSN